MEEGRLTLLSLGILYAVRKALRTATYLEYETSRGSMQRSVDRTPPAARLVKTTAIVLTRLERWCQAFLALAKPLTGARCARPTQAYQGAVVIGLRVGRHGFALEEANDRLQDCVPIGRLGRFYDCLGVTGSEGTSLCSAGTPAF